MSDILESYQEQQAIMPQESPPYSFATVGTVHPDGLSLIWPGSTEETQKHYKCNTVASFSAGQRVFVVKDSGSYIVICPIGNPGKGMAAAAVQLDNTGTTYGNVELRMVYTDKLEYRMSQKNAPWHALQNR